MLACSLSEARHTVQRQTRSMLSYSLADELYGATLYFFFPFVFWHFKSPAVTENAATLFCCEAPEMFCRLQSVTPSALGCRDDGLNFHFRANLSFKWSWVIWKPWNHLWEQGWEGFMACIAASQQGAMEMCCLYFREATTFKYSQTDVINQQNVLFRFLINPPW